MSRLGGEVPMSANSCGPCLSEKPIKKNREQEIKDLKIIINFLIKYDGYDKETNIVVGRLLTRIYHLQGPLK